MIKADRRAAAYNIIRQVEFMFVKAKAVEGYRETYRSGDPSQADTIFEADWNRFRDLVIKALNTEPSLGSAGSSVLYNIERYKPGTVRSVMGGDAIACSTCGALDKFIAAPRSLDYLNYECTGCGTSMSTLSETGASR